MKKQEYQNQTALQTAELFKKLEGQCFKKGIIDRQNLADIMGLSIRCLQYWASGGRKMPYNSYLFLNILKK